MYPMLKFPNSSSEKPNFRLLLPVEVVQNPEILLPAIHYLQHHARIAWAFVLLQESCTQANCLHFRRLLNLIGLKNVGINQTSVDYCGQGRVRIPIANMDEMVLLSQRRITLTTSDKRQHPPSKYEFAQACGRDPAIERNDPSHRFGSVEMLSGFSSVPQHPVCDTVPRIIEAIGRARWVQRVTKEQLETPEETGRLFGYHDERPESN